MQEFAPRKESTATPPNEHWPSDELLAAYIDCTLDEAESRRVKEHLADCEECFAVYVETLHFQAESTPVGNVVSFPSKEGMNPWWYRIAALLVVGIGAGAGYYALLAPLPALVTAEVTAPIPGRSDLTANFWLGPTYRGEGDEEEESPSNQASFQMGVQLVNLQVSLKAGQVRESQNVISRILGLLKTQFLTNDLQADYTKVISALETRPPNALLSDTSRLAKRTRDVFLDDTGLLDLGQWVEGGRLAAFAHDRSFFQQSDSRSFLRRLLWRDKVGLGEMKLDRPTRNSLEAISRILSKGDLQRTDYDELSGRFKEILETFYPTS